MVFVGLQQMVVVHTILEVDIHGHKVPILDEVSCHVHNLVPHKLYDDDDVYIYSTQYPAMAFWGHGVYHPKCRHDVP